MKILAASDVHGDTRWIEKLAQKAAQEKVDVVLLCGDLTFDESMTDNIIGPFKKRNLTVALIPGNHESAATTNFLSEKYKVYNLHGYSMKLGDIGFFGAGHANVGPHVIDDKELFELLKKSHDSIKDVKKKILVTHVHAEDSLTEKISFFPGSAAVKKAIAQFKPILHFCGHVHECEGIEEVIGSTRSINVGKGGKIIEV
ncbi:MAG TPA: metallophosphoesterase [Candidatus Nanoarchaeia archaeon]|nr:metallophosphoesterase [Candidatus Nanoarchaeia archaeon]